MTFTFRFRSTMNARPLLALAFFLFFVAFLENIFFLSKCATILFFRRYHDSFEKFGGFFETDFHDGDVIELNIQFCNPEIWKREGVDQGSSAIICRGFLREGIESGTVRN